MPNKHGYTSSFMLLSTPLTESHEPVVAHNQSPPPSMTRPSLRTYILAHIMPQPSIYTPHKLGHHTDQASQVSKMRHWTR